MDGVGSGKRTYEFFDEDEDETQRLDLIDIQKRILTSLLNLRGSGESEEDDEDTEVSVGDGQTMDKKALTFKVLVFDQVA